MRYTYCPVCGAHLTERRLGDDGLVPWCDACARPWWESFTTSVICAVRNERGDVALIRQSYGDTVRFVCVAGIMKPGESAEDAARREIQEEIGQEAESLRFVRSYPMAQRDMLMLGFEARVKEAPFRLSGEVAEARWFAPGEAMERLKNSRVAGLLVQEIMEKEQENK